MWYKGEATIAFEHHVSRIIEKLIVLLAQYLPGKEDKGKSIVFITPSSEEHNIGLKMMTEVYKAKGYSTYFLGSDIPWSEVVATVLEHKIDVIAISITLKRYLNELEAMINYFRDKTKAKILLGGQVTLDVELGLQKIKPDYLIKSLEDIF